jgi:hypothetical protein
LRCDVHPAIGEDDLEEDCDLDFLREAGEGHDCDGRCDVGGGGGVSGRGLSVAAVSDASGEVGEDWSLAVTPMMSTQQKGNRVAAWCGSGGSQVVFPLASSVEFNAPGHKVGAG